MYKYYVIINSNKNVYINSLASVLQIKNSINYSFLIYGELCTAIYSNTPYYIGFIVPGLAGLFYSIKCYIQ